MKRRIFHHFSCLSIATTFHRAYFQRMRNVYKYSDTNSSESGGANLMILHSKSKRMKCYDYDYIGSKLEDNLWLVKLLKRTFC